MSIIASTTPIKGSKRCPGSDIQMLWDEDPLGPTNRRCSHCGEWVPTQDHPWQLAVRHFIMEVTA
jgi:hypothetical protein